MKASTNGSAVAVCDRLRGMGMRGLFRAMSAAVIAGTLFLFSCGDDGGGGGGDISGWDGGLVLPSGYAWTEAHKYPVGDRDGIIFNSNGTFRFIDDWDNEGRWSVGQQGTYTVSGNTITGFVDGLGITTTYTIVGNKLTMPNLSMLWMGTEYVITSNVTIGASSSNSSVVNFGGNNNNNNNDNDEPPVVITPCPSSAAELTEGAWADGFIAASGTREQWFKFTATASSQYIHFNPGTLNDVNMQLYNNECGEVGSEMNFYISGNENSLRTLRNITSGQTYYIKVTPWSNYNSGAYQITFNSSTTRPSGGVGKIVDDERDYKSLRRSQSRRALLEQ